LNNSLLLNPVFDEAWVKRAELLSKLRSYQEAAFCYERALAIEEEMLTIDRRNREALNVKTELLETLKRYHELGVACERNIVDASPKELKLRKARLLFQVGKYEALGEWADKLQAEGLVNWELHYLKGMALKEMGQNQRALVALKTASESTDDEGVCVALASLLQGMGRSDEALTCFARPDLSVNALVTKASIEAEAGHNADALETLGKALAKEPRSAVAWYKKGLIHTELNQIKLAVTALDCALGIDPEYIWAWTALGRLNLKLGRRKRALQCAQAALDLDENFEEALELERQLSE
jgi:tetratricopeptide (TPR) repeat protein